jgi:hypothetical protein
MSMVMAQATKLQDDGLSKQDIVRELMRQGFSEADAQGAVANMTDWQLQNRNSQAEYAASSGASSGGGGMNVAIGVGLIVLGLVASAAGPKLFIGVIVVGAIRIMRGLAA